MGITYPVILCRLINVEKYVFLWLLRLVELLWYQAFEFPHWDYASTPISKIDAIIKGRSITPPPLSGPSNILSN